MQAIYVRKRTWRWQREGQRERERKGDRMKRQMKERKIEKYENERVLGWAMKICFVLIGKIYHSY
jgi:hypothetical protein